jgi:hypothetical protein
MASEAGAPTLGSIGPPWGAEDPGEVATEMPDSLNLLQNGQVTSDPYLWRSPAIGRQAGNQKRQEINA